MAGVRRVAAALAVLVPAISALKGGRPVHGGNGGQQDLVFMHIPYNFGHTVEKVAMFPPGTPTLTFSMFLFEKFGGFGNNKAKQPDTKALWRAVGSQMKKGGVAWGHVNPELQSVLKETGCSMYYSPQKYWPRDVARQYFGNRTVFGLLRDPYERLVAIFRGAQVLKDMKQDYGTIFKKEHLEKCDVNRAIKEALQEYVAGGDKFRSSCTFVPQAEFFDGEFGVALAVDNRKFPDSVNRVFAEHGYAERIGTEDILHVSGCPEVWAADLDRETRALVQRVYKRDFELNCKHFGYCDPSDNTCLRGVPQMCPSSQCKDGGCATDN